MLHLHTGNRLEDLADALIDDLRDSPLPPLAEQVVICESPALAGWLKQRFCLRDGIACLLDTRLPAAWLWEQARRALGLEAEGDPLDRERLVWRVLAALQDPACRADLPDIERYLQGDRGSLKQWQFACHVADVFDRYQYHRPELIREWSRAANPTDWQPRLWQQVSRGVELHRVALMDRFLERLQDDPPDSLPPRIDLFSLHNLPELLLQAFAALARLRPVHLWLLAPTPEYWADLETPRHIASRRRKAYLEAENDPEKRNAIEHEMALWQVGNPLLTQWGRAGQAFQDLLLADWVPLQEESDHFRAPGRDTLLHCLQADVHDAVTPDDDAPQPVPETEPALPSVQIHVCHGALRECQVLHDTLLHCLREDPDLQPEDILVMVPEIERYAPAIEAVFGSRGEGAPHLPYNLSDTLQAEEHPLVRAFLDLLELPRSRFGRAEVLGLANLPRIRSRFGLEEADLAELAELFDALRVYWGLDAEDRTRHGLPAIDDNSWHHGMRRVLAGFAFGGDEAAAPELAPAPNMGAQRAERAARFFDLLDALRRWSRQLDTPAGPEQWAERLDALLAELFAEHGEDEDRLQRIREAIAELKEAGALGVGQLEPGVVRHFLQAALTRQARRGRFYRGGVSFCALQPLRGVPFRVIALLGMQEAAFPRRRRHDDFDHMRDDWRHGDPDPVLEDRYLFLETLLAARERLIISYTGLDPRSNEPLEPSVLVRELLDYLDARYRIGDRPPSAVLVHEHPLHPFSLRNFAAEPPDPEAPPCPLCLPSHDRRWLAAAKAIHHHRPPRPVPEWPDAVIPLPQDFVRRVSLRELATFFRAPVRQFLQKRLRLYPPGAPELDEDEPFALDGLGQWQVLDRMLEDWMRGCAREATETHLRAAGLLPHGPWATQSLENAWQALDEMLEAAPDLRPPLARTPLDLALEIGEPPWQLSGRIHLLADDHRLVHLYPGKYALTRLLPLWIEHLCLHASGQGSATPSLGLFRDNTVRLGPLPAEQAQSLLGDLLHWYDQGQQRPLPLPPKSAAACAEALLQNREATDRALAQARRKWDDHNHPEREDYHHRLALHGHDWAPDAALLETASAILLPMSEWMETSA